MAIVITPSSDGAQIRIDGELTIYTAAESKELLMEALSAYAAFDINLEAVEEIDTSGLQLLLLMQREAKTLNKPCVLNGLSPAALDVINLLNLAELMPANDTALSGASA
jgi:anti-sigma B factor antagonist